MNVPAVVRELWKSVRIVYTDEWWLFPAVLVVAIGYPLWVGATGAAVTTIAEFVGLSLAVAPWTGRTTALAVVLGMFWVVAPAAVATQLVLNRLTNAHGNLRTCYRLRRPLALFGLPLLLVGLGLLVLAVAGSGSVAGQAILVIGSLLVAIRGTAYAYRVFALSLPLLAEAILFLAVAGLSITILAAGALGAGRHDLVADASAGIAGVVGVPALANYADGVVALGGIQLSMVAGTVVVTAILPFGAYVGIQLAVSGFQRLRKPDVKRSSLRTGQRYPGFAHPTAGGGGSGAGTSGSVGTATGGGGGGATADATAQHAAGGAGSGGGADGTSGSRDRGPDGSDGPDRPSTGPGEATASAAGGAADDGEGAAEEEGDDVSHTRVYSPPEEAEDIEVADEAEAARRSGSGKFCPSCAESYEGETRTFCPTCGARLEEP